MIVVYFFLKRKVTELLWGCSEITHLKCLEPSRNAIIIYFNLFGFQIVDISGENYQILVMVAIVKTHELKLGLSTMDSSEGMPEFLWQF